MSFWQRLLYSRPDERGRHDDGDEVSEAPPPYKSPTDEQTTLTTHDRAVTDDINTPAPVQCICAQHPQLRADLAVALMKIAQESIIGPHSDANIAKGEDFLGIDHPLMCVPSIYVRRTRAHFNRWIRSAETIEQIGKVLARWPLHVPGAEEGYMKVFKRTVEAGYFCVLPFNSHAATTLDAYRNCCTVLAMKARCLADEKRQEERSKWTLYETCTCVTFDTIARQFEDEAKR